MNEDVAHDGLKGTFDMLRNASLIETDDLGMNELEHLRMSSTNSLHSLWMSNPAALMNEIVAEKDYAEISSPTSMFREEQKFELEPSPLVSNVKQLAVFSSETEPSSLRATSSPDLVGMLEARKEPEEEYFRLSCLALKIIYNDHD